MIKSQRIFFHIECLNNNTHEQIQEQHRDYNDEHDEDDHHVPVLISLWLHIDSYSIRGVPHDTNPAFSSLDCEKC